MTEWIFTLQYAPAQLERFLLNTSLNPGTWLEPIPVSNLIHVRTGNFSDLSITEVPGKVDRLIWGMEGEGIRESDVVRKPRLQFIEIYSLEAGLKTYPDVMYWNNIFKQEDLEAPYCTLAPNGALYRQPVEGEETISLGLRKKENRDELFFGYRAVFTVLAGDETYYCRIDPLVKVRSSDDETILP